jgi:hypothetical protein
MTALAISGMIITGAVVAMIMFFSESWPSWQEENMICLLHCFC